MHCSAIALRGYQTDGIAKVRDRVCAGVRRVCFVLPTGGGKTVVAANIVLSALALGSRILFVVHRRELMKQTLAKLLRAGIPVTEIGIIMAGVKDARGEYPLDLGVKDGELWARHGCRRPGARIQIASIDSLRNRAFPLADLVVIDECHRAEAPTYKKIAGAYPNATLLGLTATPIRGDGKGLKGAFDELVEVASIKQLIEWGYLVRPRGKTVDVLPDLSAARITGGDYRGDDLEKALNTGVLVGNIVEHWQRYGENKRTVCFAVSVAHSRAIVERFRAAGIAAEHLDGETPTEERDAILARLESGVTRLVSNVGVLTEGWDMPSVKCLILARPTKSLGLYLQMVGRILRPWEGEEAIILDHSGSVLEHGMPYVEREWSLEGDKRKRRASQAANDVAKICKAEGCFEVLDIGEMVCPKCGTEQPQRKAADLTESAGELIDADLAVKLAGSVKQLEKWDAMVADWRAENAKRMAEPDGRPRKPGWLFHHWRKKNRGLPPPKGAKMPKLTDAEVTRLDEVEARKEKASPAFVVNLFEAPAMPRRRVAW